MYRVTFKIKITPIKMRNLAKNKTIKNNKKINSNIFKVKIIQNKIKEKVSDYLMIN